ncbi:hypothetical protein LCM20_02985 [Halobacillus litoralis]|uniref:hypothetical protein n=1 Tax=Halobacillus litoralis TaxID=45668 RepID=UPI001CD3CB7F|nr:hypothetical protein [Halobacillus litoralis]MCA0969556.1 hypothetical protein [Halobacillus litoralis]
MQFRALSLDSNRIDVQGFYSVRKDSTIVVELDQNLTNSFVQDHINKIIHRIRVHALDDRLSAAVFRGPYRLQEQHGLLIFKWDSVYSEQV